MIPDAHKLENGNASMSKSPARFRADGVAVAEFISELKAPGLSKIKATSNQRAMCLETKETLSPIERANTENEAAGKSIEMIVCAMRQELGCVFTFASCVFYYMVFSYLRNAHPTILRSSTLW